MGHGDVIINNFVWNPYTHCILVWNNVYTKIEAEDEARKFIATHNIAKS